jgi:CBS domain-containing protein
MRVREMMTQNPVCCLPSDVAQMVAQTLRDENIGSMPVVSDRESKRLEGIITDRDLCCSIVAQGLDPKSTPIAAYITRNPVTCRSEQSLDSCAKLMQVHQIRRILVVDRDARCIGILAQADLARLQEPDKVQRTVAEISKPSQTIITAPDAA